MKCGNYGDIDGEINNIGATYMEPLKRERDKKFTKKVHSCVNVVEQVQGSKVFLYSDSVPCTSSLPTYHIIRTV